MEGGFDWVGIHEVDFATEKYRRIFATDYTERHRKKAEEFL